MDAPRLLEFLRRHRVAVEASVSAGRGAQAAVWGSRSHLESSSNV